MAPLIRNFTLVTVFLGSTLALAVSGNFDFDQDKVGVQPQGWESGSHGKKGAPHWSVVLDKEAPSKPNVLKQDHKTTYGYLISKALPTKDGVVSAKFKIESGKEDPEAGVIFRFIDAKNYYYVRANSLENNIIFYRMSAGQKQAIKSVDVPVPGNKWHGLRIEFRNDAIKVEFNGKELFSAKDSTIKDKGGLGVWTTADTIALFDDVTVAPL